MYSLNLPGRYVYVVYEDGKCENVAMQDILEQDKADYYKKEWETARGKQVKSVELREGDKKTVRYSYEY